MLFAYLTGKHRTTTWVNPADKIFASKRTVETNRQMLIEKFGAKNTASLVKTCMIMGVVK